MQNTTSRVSKIPTRLLFKTQNIKLYTSEMKVMTANVKPHPIIFKDNIFKASKG